MGTTATATNQNKIMTEEKTMKKYMCVVCGWVYSEADGSPEDGIAPGTAWKDVPDDWVCPECGAMKSDFEMMEL